MAAIDERISLRAAAQRIAMSKLEVIFRLGLAHPLLIMDNTQRRARSCFSKTKNDVWVEAERGLRPETATGQFDVLLLHVERECQPEDRDDARSYARLVEWGIIGDAATTLWRFLEFTREEDFLQDKTVAGYLAAPSKTPQDNPVVQTARVEVVFDGEVLTTLPFSTVPAIQIRWGAWDRVCEKLERGQGTPPYRSFLLDAYYFATSGDPIRAVVMGCAAWETALRQFLSSIGKKNVEYKNVPRLRRMAEVAKGAVLPDWLSKPVTELARLRNKLLHEGKKGLAKEDIVGMILAVDEAIIWLFASSGVP